MRQGTQLVVFGSIHEMTPGASLCLPVNADKFVRVKPAEKKPFRANLQAVNFCDHEQQRTDWIPNNAHATDVNLAFDLARGRVVRQEARTRSRCQVRWYPK